MSKIKLHCPALVEAAVRKDEWWKQSYEDGERDGHDEAVRDVAKGELFLELTDAREGDSKFEKLLQERYHVGIKRAGPFSDQKSANKVAGRQDG